MVLGPTAPREWASPALFRSHPRWVMPYTTRPACGFGICRLRLSGFGARCKKRNGVDERNFHRVGKTQSVKERIMKKLMLWLVVLLVSICWLRPAEARITIGLS